MEGRVRGVACFFDDLKEHGVGDNVIMLMFSESAAGPGTTVPAPTTGPVAAFVMGEPVKGGQYSEFPPMRSEDSEQGAWSPNMTSGACIARFWRTGWGWTPSLSWAGRLKSSRTSSRTGSRLGASPPVLYQCG